ncbi:beta-1,4-glucuronyltransferase 1-like isoform X1 [Agrilus planipennis]|uniref:Beta-1,4-glucuronyltransferase 1-like isoform X1 n=1 Tax=Agrilus planipennis TaxID=224129 RepID=A0A7F5RMH3_AGRPL|nr:beta-1,4-glucuronyltransferase 1-like isoform X1 [Agrilus planipennis]
MHIMKMNLPQHAPTKLLVFLLFLIIMSLYLQFGYSTRAVLSETENIKETEKSPIVAINTDAETGNSVISKDNLTTESYTFQRIKEITKCHDLPRQHNVMQWGPYWVLNNFVAAKRTYKCEESVTFATTATYNFLGNVLPIVESWDGPVSVAVYAPGSDFNLALESIAYLRECGNPLVTETVSFHLFFQMTYFPDKNLANEKFSSGKAVNCSLKPPYETYSSGQSFKDKHNELFMVNVARNIARKMSETHFILSADIEMYPSLNISSRFLHMISKEDPETYSKQPVVYAIHAFEVNEGVKPPLNKSELREMIHNKTAERFHFKVCGKCHNFPHFESWLSIDSEEMEITESVTRTKTFVAWEPFFIGTNHDPWYDERVSWEGMRDKRIQLKNLKTTCFEVILLGSVGFRNVATLCFAFALCLLGYKFNILSDGFLVHKPGHKKTEYFGNRLKVSLSMAETIETEFVPQYRKFYGNNPACVV